MRIDQVIFGVPLGLFVLAAVGTLAIFIASYRSTVASVGRTLRVVLSSLRSVALLAALLVLADPYVSFRWEERAKPVVAAFLDVSKSMDQTDRLGHRGQEALQWLNQTSGQIEDVAQLVTYSFARDVRRMRWAEPESVRFDGEGTDLASVIEFGIDSLDEVRTAAICLLTDGVHTVGADPGRVARRLRIPVYSVVFGDTSRTVDVAVAGVGGPEVAYVGRPFSVRVGIRKAGDVDYLGRLSVFQDSAALFTRDLRLRRDQDELWVTVDLTARRPGVTRFRFELSPLPGETALSNNRSELFVKVRPTRKRILLIGGEPSADFGFLRRCLERDSTVELQSYCALGGNRWIPSPPWSTSEWEFDEAILVGFPAVDAPLPPAGKEWFRSRLRGKKVVLFANRDFDGKLASELLDVPPGTFSVRARAPKPVYCFPVEGREFHALVRLSESSAEVSRMWRSLPPAVATGWTVTKADRMVPLMLGREEDSVPDTVAWIIRQGERPIAFFSIAGFWQWGFAPLAFGNSTEVFERLVANLANWVYVSDDGAGLRVEPTRQVFEGNEPVRFRGFVVQEDGTPVADARVVVEIAGGGGKEVLVLEAKGKGIYEGTVASLPSGRYHYRAEASVGDRILGKAEGSFAVQAFAQELIEPAASLEFPRMLAKLTGGVAMTSSSSEALIDSLRHLLKAGRWSSLAEEKRAAWNLRHSWQALAILLTALAVEWTIRRRSGLL